MTAMEVFLYDPLFKWLLSPIEAFQLQANMGEENPINRFGYKGLETQDRTDDILHLNSEAAKALLRINNKLQVMRAEQKRIMNEKFPLTFSTSAVVPGLRWERGHQRGGPGAYAHYRRLESKTPVPYVRWVGSMGLDFTN